MFAKCKLYIKRIKLAVFREGWKITQHTCKLRMLGEELSQFHTFMHCFFNSIMQIHYIQCQNKKKKTS